MSFGSIIDAWRGLTIPAVAVVGAVPLQVPTPCASSVSALSVELLRLKDFWSLGYASSFDEHNRFC